VGGFVHLSKSGVLNGRNDSLYSVSVSYVSTHDVDLGQVVYLAMSEFLSRCIFSLQEKIG